MIGGVQLGTEIPKWTNRRAGLERYRTTEIILENSKNFGAAGNNLGGALAIFAQKISTIETEVLVENGRTYANLEAYTAFRLIPLDKNPDVRPIDVKYRPVKYCGGLLGKPYFQSLSQRS